MKKRVKRGPSSRNKFHYGASKKVVIGGTFDIFHNGHKALLKRAFGLGKVMIGLTSDAMAEKMKRRKVRDFKLRKKELENFIKAMNFRSSSRFAYARVKEFKVKPHSREISLRGMPKIVKIENKFGTTLKEDFDFIVVSPETYKTALLINKEREKIGKKPIKIVKIDFVLAQDGKPISSTRILKGEIDREGRLLIC